MPRTAVTITTVNGNASNTPAAGTAADPTNHHSIAAKGETSRFLIVAKNTAGTPKNVIVKAGANPPAVRASLGDLTVQVPATTGERWLIVESSRFTQADGSIYLDLESGFAGTIAVYKLPAVL